MPDANFRVHLGKFSLGTSWQLYKAPIDCWSIELTGDTEWAWCSDKDSATARVVGALQREMVIPASQMIIKKDDPIIWIKAQSAGLIYEKCVR